MAVSKIQYRIIFGDTDALGIVYHSNYFLFFEMARAEWFRQYLRPYTHYIEMDFYLIVLESFCRHKKPARYDDMIEIECWPTDVKNSTFAVEYLVRHKNGGDVIAEGYTLHTVTRKDGSLRRFPREFLSEISTLAEEPKLHKPRRKGIPEAR